MLKILSKLLPLIIHELADLIKKKIEDKKQKNQVNEKS